MSGYSTTLASPLVVFPLAQNSGWIDPNNVNLGAPAFWKNGSTNVSAGVAPGEISLHPGQAGELAVVRWTAPRAGTFTVAVQFFAGDIGDTDGYVLKNGTTLFTAPATDTNPTFNQAVTLIAGDTLDVAVGAKGSFYYDNTPVSFVVTAP